MPSATAATRSSTRSPPRPWRQRSSRSRPSCGPAWANGRSVRRAVALVALGPALGAAQQYVAHPAALLAHLLLQFAGLRPDATQPPVGRGRHHQQPEHEHCRPHASQRRPPWARLCFEPVPSGGRRAQVVDRQVCVRRGGQAFAVFSPFAAVLAPRPPHRMVGAEPVAEAFAVAVPQLGAQDRAADGPADDPVHDGAPLVVEPHDRVGPFEDQGPDGPVVAVDHPRGTGDVGGYLGTELVIGQRRPPGLVVDAVELDERHVEATGELPAQRRLARPRRTDDGHPHSGRLRGWTTSWCDRGGLRISRRSPISTTTMWCTPRSPSTSSRSRSRRAPTGLPTTDRTGPIASWWPRPETLLPATRRAAPFAKKPPTRRRWRPASTAILTGRDGGSARRCTPNSSPHWPARTCGGRVPASRCPTRLQSRCTASSASTMSVSTPRSAASSASSGTCSCSSDPCLNWRLR